MSTKNHSGDKRGGFVPLDDIAGAVELPNGRALTPAAPQALHHFTRLDQIDQLVEASEADADLGFMARLLALCSLPRTNPGDQKDYIRRATLRCRRCAGWVRCADGQCSGGTVEPNDSPIDMQLVDRTEGVRLFPTWSNAACL